GQDRAGAPLAVVHADPVQYGDGLGGQQRRVGLSGFLLRPAVIAHDLPAVTRALVPELQRRGLFRGEYEADTLRGLLGLDRPANRYAAAATLPAA
ncbi:hypothetical protein ACWDA9_41205, partial [Streptomyces sp. NPDC001193]